MLELSVSFRSRDDIEFLLDDDPQLSWLGQFDGSHYDRLFIFIDMNVRKQWGQTIRDHLRCHGKRIYWYSVKPQESSKSLDAYPGAISFLEKNNCGRFDLVLAIGGGIVMDLVGFVSSTYMRGLPFYAVPTTLIGQMDATTAGKTCLNTSCSKNVLGTFYYPSIVYNNISFLKTNSSYYLRQGYSEVFKYGLLASAPLIEMLRAYRVTPVDSLLLEILRLSIETRVAIRKRDPLASNLGHTFGHAIEKLSGFQILHGDAISAGTVLALNFAQEEGLISDEKVREIVLVMKELGLNVWLDRELDPKQLVKLMLRDKKSSSVELHLVLIKGVAKPFRSGKSCFYDVAPRRVEHFLARFIKAYPFMRSGCATFLHHDRLYTREELK